jgi:hypothetical protein
MAQVANSRNSVAKRNLSAVPVADAELNASIRLFRLDPCRLVTRQLPNMAMKLHPIQLQHLHRH